LKSSFNQEMNGLNHFLDKIKIPSATETRVIAHVGGVQFLTKPQGFPEDDWDEMANRPTQLPAQEGAKWVEYEANYRLFASGLPGALLYTDRLQSKAGALRTLDNGVQEIHSPNNPNSVIGLRFIPHSSDLSDEDIQAARDEVISKIEDQAHRASALVEEGRLSAPQFSNFQLSEKEGYVDQLLELDPMAAGSLTAAHPEYLGITCNRLNAVMGDRRRRAIGNTVLSYLAPLGLTLTGIGAGEGGIAIMVNTMRLMKAGSALSKVARLGAGVGQIGARYAFVQQGFSAAGYGAMALKKGFDLDNRSSNYWLNSNYAGDFNPSDRNAVELAQQSYDRTRSQFTDAAAGTAMFWLFEGGWGEAVKNLSGK
jgi:hypothetical protein